MADEFYEISSVSLPEDFETFRHPPARTRISEPQFWDGYDRTTLIYDAVYIADDNILRICCPNPVNLAPILLHGTFSIDGTGARPERLRRQGQFWTLDFRVSASPKRFGLRYRHLSFDAPLNATNGRDFAGKNCLYSMVKNGDAKWIHDWALFHRNAHGANAAVVVNNGSKDFTSADIAVALRDAGLTTVRVVEAPLRYGPVSGARRGLGRAKFLQVAMMNHMRDTLLRDARAVLPVDIDELVVSETGESIFDHAVRSRSGYVTIPGRWRHSGGQESRPRHASHRFRDPQEERCEPKYCIVPGSVLGRWVWGVHSLAAVPRNLFRGRGFHFLHCRQISTSWKFARAFDADRALEADPAAGVVLGRLLPPMSSEAPPMRAAREDAA